MRQERRPDVPVTRSFRDTVRRRMEGDTQFRAAVLQEAQEAFDRGEPMIGKALLQDLAARDSGDEASAIDQAP